MEIQMNFDELENHQEKCRLCLASLEFSDDNVMISDEIESKFSALIGIELRATGEFSNTVCGYCDRKLEDLRNFQQRLFDIQAKLYTYVDQVYHDYKPNVSRYSAGDVVFEVVDEGIIKEERPEEYDEVYLESDGEQSQDQKTLNYIIQQPISCETCGIYLNSEKSYRRHLATHRNDSMPVKTEGELDLDSSGGKKWWQPRNCKYCNEFCQTDKTYRQHLRQHKAAGDQKLADISDVPKGQTLCPLCAKVMLKGSLKVHMLMVHQINPSGAEFHCDLCPYKSIRKRALVLHMKVHMELNPTAFQCRYCGRNFAKSHSKRIHERRAHEELGKQFECECGKTFLSEAGLYLHRKEIHEMGEYPCTYCGAIFPSKVKLKNHNDRLHMPKKVCYICGKSVSPGVLFLKHMQRHGPRINCWVEGCPKSFTDKSGLTYHIQSEHEPHSTHNCDHCHAVFNNSKKLRLHIRRQHESSSVTCEVYGCNYSTTRKSNLVGHYKAHKDIDEDQLEQILTELKTIKMAG